MPLTTYKLLQEDNDYLLLETGDKIFLSSSGFYVIDAGVGVFSLTGIGITRLVYNIALGVGSFVLTGIDVLSNKIIPSTIWLLKYVASTLWTKIVSGK